MGRRRVSAPVGRSVRGCNGRPRLLFVVVFQTVRLLGRLVGLLVRGRRRRGTEVSSLVRQEGRGRRGRPTPSIARASGRAVPTIARPFGTPTAAATRGAIVPPEPEVSRLTRSCRVQLRRVVRGLGQRGETVRARRIGGSLVSRSLGGYAKLFRKGGQGRLRTRSGGCTRAVGVVGRKLSRVIRSCGCPAMSTFLRICGRNGSRCRSCIGTGGR